MRAAVAAVCVLLVQLALARGSAVRAADVGDAVGAGRFVNAYRAAAGVPPLAVDARLNAAALAHARYLVLNADREGALPDGTLHSEASGLPGYTGAAPVDRGRAFGYEAG